MPLPIYNTSLPKPIFKSIESFNLKPFWPRLQAPKTFEVHYYKNFFQTSKVKISSYLEKISHFRFKHPSYPTPENYTYSNTEYQLLNKFYIRAVAQKAAEKAADEQLRLEIDQMFETGKITGEEYFLKTGQLYKFMAYNNSNLFQDPVTPSAEAIIDFHHDLMFYLIIVVTLVFWLLIRSIWFYNLTTIFSLGMGVQELLISKILPLEDTPKHRFHLYKRPHLVTSLKNHDIKLEITWTVVPALILLIMVIPSFALIYSLDELIDPVLTLKVIGHQWYWSYQYVMLMKFDTTVKNDKFIDIFFRKRFDSVMKSVDDLLYGEYRLLDVHRRLYVPLRSVIRVLVTSEDVLHSWAIPSMGIKVDACPGRLNQTVLFAKREGVFYGQCSEICGVNHAFMPISIRVSSFTMFYKWFFKYFEYKKY